MCVILWRANLIQVREYYNDIKILVREFINLDNWKFSFGETFSPKFKIFIITATFKLCTSIGSREHALLLKIVIKRVIQQNRLYGCFSGTFVNIKAIF